MDIPQAHRGLLFNRTGAFAFYAGGSGLTGPVLGPGTHFLGAYDELRLIDCSMATLKEPLTVLTKDGVQFGVHIYVRFSAECNDQAVQHLLSILSPDSKDGVTISVAQIFKTFVQPALAAAVRENISPYRANEVNEQREKILAEIRKTFLETMAKDEIDVVKVQEFNLTNLDFPEALDTANVERAVQTILRDKAVAERERVQDEIQTAIMRKELEQREGDAVAARIDAIGAALKRNPDYMQFDLQSKMPEMYERAGRLGNLIITAPSPQIMIQHAQTPRPPNSAPPAKDQTRFEYDSDVTNASGAPRR